MAHIAQVLILFYVLEVIHRITCATCTCDPDRRSRPIDYEQVPNENTFSETVCETGHYINQLGQCAPCPNGTFLTKMMAKGDGQNRACIPCYLASKNETVVKNCSATQDTEVKCSTGYYRPSWSSSCPCTAGDCKQCDVCGLGDNLYLDFEVVPCSQFQNTKCCEEENTDVDCSPKTTPSQTTSILTQIVNVNSTPSPVQPTQMNRIFPMITKPPSSSSSTNMYSKLFVMFSSLVNIAFCFI